MKIIFLLSLLALSASALAQDCRLSIRDLDRALLSGAQLDQITSDFSQRGFTLVSRRDLTPGDYVLDDVFRSASGSLVELNNFESRTVLMGEVSLKKIDSVGGLQLIRKISYMLRRAGDDTPRALWAISRRAPKCKSLEKKDL